MSTPQDQNPEQKPLPANEVGKSSKPSEDISPETIHSMVEVQKMRVQNEAASISFKEKELAANVELGKLQIGHQAEIEKRRPNENRKSFALVFGGVIIILLIVLGFLGWCMSMGKEQFVIEFLKYSLYPISAGGGYWFGRKSIKPPKDTPSASSIVDADVVS